MRKILFIVPYPLNSAPSQRFRFEQYFKILKKKGYSYHLAPFWSIKAWNILYDEGQTLKKLWFVVQGFLKRILLVFTIPVYDLIFIHREVAPLGPPIFEFVIGRILRKKIIYDFDDAIWLPNTSLQNSLSAKLKWHNKVKNTCKWSSKVSCGNDFLANFAKRYNDSVVVNPTTIDTSYHHPSHTWNSKPKIGWTGTHSTSKYLHSLTKVLTTLKSKFDFEMVIISNQKPEWEFEEYHFIEWSLENEITELQKFDIGIMPLEDTVWEQGKCGFKALQYMALEIPTVASDVGANSSIIDHGINGYLCKNENDWLNHLSALLKSQELRDKIGKEGRNKIIDHYSVESNTTRFLSLFE